MREVIGVRGRERSGEERGGTDGEGRKGGGRDGDTGLMGGERGGEGRREGGRRRVYKREEGAEMGIHTDYRIANLLQSTTHQRPICASPSSPQSLHSALQLWPKVFLTRSRNVL